MNINSSNAIRPCTSCQMCGAVCPKNAISIKLDEEGFYRPSVNASLCIDCGLCVSYCYKFDENIEKTNQDELNNFIHYAAYANQISITKETTSGGIADILAKHLIKSGFKVIGVEFDCKTNSAQHKVANNIEETHAFRGSKYIQSYAVSAFRFLVKQCKKEKFAVFGLPCQIYSLAKYLEKNNRRKNCVLIDLYCHGCPSMLVWEKVSDNVRKKMNVSHFDKVVFRSKKKGWGKFVLEIKAKRKSYLSTPFHNEFYDLFFSNQVLNESCFDCELRSTLSYTDIRLGDFWGPKFKTNNKGVSGVTVVTEKGKLVFNEISDAINTTQIPLTSFLPYQSWGHKYNCNKDLRAKTFSILKTKNSNIKNAVSIVNNRRSLKDKIKILAKQVLFMLNINF